MALIEYGIIDSIAEVGEGLSRNPNTTVCPKRWTADEWIAEASLKSEIWTDEVFLDDEV